MPQSTKATTPVTWSAGVGNSAARKSRFSRKSTVSSGRIRQRGLGGGSATFHPPQCLRIVEGIAYLLNGQVITFAPIFFGRASRVEFDNLLNGDTDTLLR